MPLEGSVIKEFIFCMCFNRLNPFNYCNIKSQQRNWRNLGNKFMIYPGRANWNIGCFRMAINEYVKLVLFYYFIMEDNYYQHFRASILAPVAL